MTYEAIKRSRTWQEDTARLERSMSKLSKADNGFLKECGIAPVKFLYSVVGPKIELRIAEEGPE